MEKLKAREKCLSHNSGVRTKVQGIDLGYILKAGWQDLLMGWVWSVKESGTKDNAEL